jgi:predicted transcriptional regulator
MAQNGDNGRVPPWQLRYARLAAGLFPSNVARHLGVNRVTVWRWETGRTRPRPEQAARFLEGCAANLLQERDWLLGRPDRSQCVKAPPPDGPPYPD